MVQTIDGSPRSVATQAVLGQLPEFRMERLEKLFAELEFEQGIQIVAESVELLRIRCKPSYDLESMG